ncbi:hypothetical protein GCM10018952_54960 [Streptosporangium vulgare]
MGRVKAVPPCTTRCPIAVSSGESSPRPSAASRAATASSPARWSATGEPGSPMRSTVPEASRSAPDRSRYFREEDPELRTSTRPGSPPGTGPLPRFGSFRASSRPKPERYPGLPLPPSSQLRPEVPEVPAAPEVPEIPAVPKVPAIPEVPEAPSVRVPRSLKG